MVSCPLCDSEIDLEDDDLDEGDLVTCEECGGEFRVLSVDPLELEPFEEDEDEEQLDFDDENEDDRWH